MLNCNHCDAMKKEWDKVNVKQDVNKLEIDCTR